MEQFLSQFIASTGFIAITWGQFLMLVVSCVLLYLGIVREFEPLLLVPIAFGMLLANLPMSGITDGPKDGLAGGLIYYLYQGVKLGIYPPLIFLGIGAMTDFGPLIANPWSLLLGAAQLAFDIPFLISPSYYLGFRF